MRESLEELKNALWYLKKPLSLHSMTLDAGDVNVAKEMLSNLGNNPIDSGDLVKEYEQRFSRWNGSRASFAFMSGREALTASIHALDLSAGSEVIIPGYTCVVVPNAFKYENVSVKHVDIELETYGIDAEKLRQKMSEDTDAVLLQHLYGLVARDYEEIVEIAERYGASVIEDCAHSTGAEYDGKKVGNRGDIAIFSSEKSKAFTTIQGGIASTNRDDLSKKIKQYQKSVPEPDEDLIKAQLQNVILNYNRYKNPYRRITGPISDITIKEIKSTTRSELRGEKPPSYGRKMPESIAALGINQLKKIDYYNQRRRQNASRWQEWAQDMGYELPNVVENSTPIFLRYPILVEPQKKQDLTWVEDQLGYRPGKWFTGKHHPVDTELPECPNADRAVESCINMPCLFPKDRYED